MASIPNLSKLAAKLKAKGNQFKKRTAVVVGFTQSYGIYVHENLQAYHPVGQAKFLEQPARQLQGELAKVVNATIASGGSLEQGLVNAGLRLQREAQKLTPVDTGALRASAFTAKEDEADKKAKEAYANSEKIRKQALKKGNK